MILAGSGAGVLARSVARRLGLRSSPVRVERFPDGELLVRLPSRLPREVALFQSFHAPVQERIVEAIFAAAAARAAGARRIDLVAPYFPYLRQDRAFRAGEGVSHRATARLFSAWFDGVVIVEPHLHRTPTLDELFAVPARAVSAAPVIAAWLRRLGRHVLVVGPDQESVRWARAAAALAGCETRILSKRRLSPSRVRVEVSGLPDLAGRDVVLVDDILSTGRTLVEAAKGLRARGARTVRAAAVHGLFAPGALAALRRARVPVVCTNTVPGPAARLDVAPLLAAVLGQQ